MNYLDITALTLLFVGGINWLFIGLINFDLVQYIVSPLGSISDIVARVFFIIVGLSAIYAIKFIDNVYRRNV